MTNERRAHPRLPLEYAVQLQDISGHTGPLLRHSFSRNISHIGLQIVSFDFYPVEEAVRIKLYSSESMCMLDVIGKIVWVQQFPYQQKFMVGLRFTEVGESGRERLVQLIRSVRTGPHAAGYWYH